MKGRLAPKIISCYLKRSASKWDMVLTEGDEKKWTHKHNSPPVLRGRPSEFYQAYISDMQAGFEFGEHQLSGQLLFVFANVPDLSLAEDLEAMGFAWVGDERTFTADANDALRQKAFKRASEFVSAAKGRSPG